MSLLRRLSNLGSPSRNSLNEGRNSPNNKNIVLASENKLNEHCQTIQDIITDTSKVSLENCKRVLNHFSCVLNILSEEKCNDDGQLGSSLEYVLQIGLFDTVVTWSLCQRNNMKDLVKEQLKLYKTFIKTAKQPMLIFDEITTPLKRLLRSCTGKQSDEDLEFVFVDLLHQFCICVNQDVSLLSAHFINTSSSADISVFALLIPYLHNEGEIGSKSRDAVLLCTSLSMLQQQLAHFICEETNFCPVLATGLSALYSRLPNTLDVPGDDWYSLKKGLWTTVPELKSFITSLEFCNDVIQTAHPRIQTKLLDFIYHGFLVSVMAPALNQNSTDALVAATAYFDLFLGSVTEPKLMKVFLKFILQEKLDEIEILHSLIQRIDAKNELCLVTLALFNTLVNLNSEDVMIELVLKYLLPCNHVMGSQRKLIQEIDLYGKVAVRFLTLIPSCCFPDVYIEDILQEPSNNENKEQTMLETVERMSLSSDFLTYLLDVRKSLSDRRAACSCWSALWDGLDPVHCEQNMKNEKMPLQNGSVLHKSLSSPDMLETTDHEKPSIKRSISKDQMATPLGPFFERLFEKLEQMPENTVSVNQLLTGILTSLVEYPQPLLRSFLLNHSLVLQPHVKSIFQILNSVKTKVEASLSQLDNIHLPLEVAKQNLLLKEEQRKRSRSSRRVSQISPKQTNDKRRSSDVISGEESSRNTFVQVKLENDESDCSSDDKNLEREIEQSSTWILLNLGPKGISRERTRRKHIHLMKNSIYCAVLMEDWMKKLAAVSLEHAIQPYPNVEVISGFE